jgi:hypothetical protein
MRSNSPRGCSCSHSVTTSSRSSGRQRLQRGFVSPSPPSLLSRAFPHSNDGSQAHCLLHGQAYACLTDHRWRSNLFLPGLKARPFSPFCIKSGKTCRASLSSASPTIARRHWALLHRMPSRLLHQKSSTSICQGSNVRKSPSPCFAAAW